jgi:hypothetical protein
MTDRSELMRHADALRKQADQEMDNETRDRLVRMADHYAHLVESQSWSDTHPVSIASVTEAFHQQD